MNRVSDDEVELGPDYAFYYKGEPYSGVVFDNLADGTLVSENTYARGWRHGVSKTWFPGGQLKVTTPYTMGWVHGWEEERFRDGPIRRRTLYEHSVRTKEQEFDRDGTLVREWQIDPGSSEYRRLQANKAGEAQRLEKMYAIYGHPDAEGS